MKRAFLFFLMICFRQLLLGQSLTLKLDSVLHRMHNQYSFDGVVLVAHNSLPLYKKAFGWANRDWNVANTIDTKFRLGSVSKQFIRFIIHILTNAVKMKLDDNVDKYLPEFNSGDKKNITIQNLLTHTSGIFDYTDIPGFNSMVLYPKDSLVKMMASQKSTFQPSIKYGYSNSNFYLLVIIAEKISGEKFEDILKKIILTPARMKNSGLEHKKNILPKRASPYTHDKSEVINGEYIEMDNVAGGIYSTAEDLLLWSLFVQQQFAKSQFLKSAIKPFQLADGTISIYSCGWCLLPEKIMHQGHINGFANHISIDTVNHYTVIILSNNDFKELYVTGEIITSILHGNTDAINSLTQKMSQRQLKDYEGEYVKGKDTVFNKIENGELISYYNNQSLRWKPFAKDEFFCEAFEGNIFFQRDHKNEIISVRNFEDYNWVEYKKVK